MNKLRRVIICASVIFVLLLIAFFSRSIKEDTSAEPKKFYCDNVSRAASCNDVGDSVCGWFNQSVQCFKYPCAVEFPLRCEACKNPQVEYYTFGACPID